MKDIVKFLNLAGGMSLKDQRNILWLDSRTVINDFNRESASLSNSTLISVAPASMEFSTSSLTIDGRSFHHFPCGYFIGDFRR